MCWRDGSVAKSTCCSCKRTEFSSQHIHSSSRLSVNLVFRGPHGLFWPLGHCIHVIHRQTSANKFYKKKKSDLRRDYQRPHAVPILQYTHTSSNQCSGWDLMYADSGKIWSSCSKQYLSHAHGLTLEIVSKSSKKKAQTQKGTAVG